MKNLADLEDVKLSSLSELEAFFREKNIPSEQIRFFVNENRNDARCFGIYQDINTGNFIVYKNKDDGTRSVRYEGVDEKLAVNIFFSKLKEEMYKRDTQGLYQSTVSQVKEAQQAKRSLIGKIIGIIAVVISVIVIFFSLRSCNTPRVGYYNFNGSNYYYGNNAWWYYDDFYDDWEYYDGYMDGYNDYYYGNNYDSSYGYPDIEDSSNYESYSDNNYDSYDYSSDDFDSYDFSSWDSSSTDWGSDW